MMPASPRRTLLLAAVGALVAQPAAAADAAAPVVTLFGDSIAAGYGLPPDEGLAHQLALALAKLGSPAVVRNAGFPGDTTPRGLARLSGAVRRDTAVCVVEFGGNDRRLGLPPSLTRASLDAIVSQLKARGVAVVLVGVGTGERADVYRQAAEAHQVALYPDVFTDVGADLRQADGVHPNAEGAKHIAAGLAPLVAQALRAQAAAR
jgi:acyl-CoA thioesterase-1